MELWHDLALVHALCRNYDRLLYVLLGDPAEVDGLTVMDELIGEDSVVASVMEEFLAMLKSWNASPSRSSPLVVLKAIGAPFASQNFAKRSRGKIFRLTTTTDRRFGTVVCTSWKPLNFESCIAMLFYAGIPPLTLLFSNFRFDSVNMRAVAYVRWRELCVCWVGFTQHTSAAPSLLAR